MTNIEIKRFVMKHLQEITSLGFYFQKNILFKEDNDIIIGFCLEKSGVQKDSLYIWSFSQPLYVLAEDINLSFGRRLRKEAWQIKGNSNLDNDALLMIQLMRDELNGYLNQVNNPDKFYQCFNDKCVNLRMLEAVVYSALKSNNNQSEDILSNYINILKQEDLSINWISRLLENAEELMQSLSNSDSVKFLLDKNIEITKNNLGI